MIVPTLLCFVASASPTASSTTTLTLDAALALARRNEPRILGSEAAVRASRARVDAAIAAYYPRLDVQLQYQRSTANFVVTPTFSRSQLAASLKPGTSLDTVNVYQLGATAQATLYDFGRIDGTRDAAEAGARASEADLEELRLSVALAVRLAYVGVLATRAVVALANEVLANERRHLDQTNRFVELGARPRIDRTSAELAVANAELELLRAEDGNANAKLALNRAMGVEDSIGYDVAPIEIDATLEAVPVDALVSDALDRRPDVRRNRARSEAADGMRRSALATWFPTVGAQAAFSTATVDGFPFGFNGFVGLGLTWNVFNGFETPARVAQADAEADAVSAELAGLRQQIRNDIERQILAIVEAKQRAQVSRRAIAAASERLALAEGRYRAGAGDALELADAQLADARAKTERIRASHDLSIARAILARTLGRE